jgi:histidine kinase/DNA gyrase B/HSP90-like ATPase
MTRSSRSAPPKASAMLESLRGLGYSTETAIADTIDNSIAASATKVDLIFHWAQTKSFVAIVDNGHGMTNVALESAMRLGDRDPLQKRGSRDLGRFGLGMKTAAFSQGRRLTVASRTATGEFSCFSWDLEILKASEDGGWHLLEGADEDSRGAMDLLPLGGTGTLVLWELLDRLVPPGSGEQDFLDSIDRVEKHLAMVFHRYLEGLRPRLKIVINGGEKPVQGWNPFAVSASAGHWSSPVEQLNSEHGTCIMC